MKTLFSILLLSVLLGQVNAQSSEAKAKAYYFTAVEQFEQGNYAKAIEYCDQIEELLGSTNARIEAVRLKSYYDKGDTEKAQTSLKKFLKLQADEALLKDISAYIVKIEDAEKERIRKAEAAEEARIRKEKAAEEARLRQEAIRQERLANAHFSEGLAKFQASNGKYGYIDKEGNIEIDAIYDNAQDFKNGIAMVERDEKYGYINKDAEAFIPLQYDLLGPEFDSLGFNWFFKPNTSSDRYSYPMEVGILTRAGDTYKSFYTKLKAEDQHADEELQTRLYIYYNSARYLLEDKSTAEAIPLLKWTVESKAKDNPYKYAAAISLAEIYYELKDKISTFDAKEKAIEYYQAAYDHNMTLNRDQYLRLGNYYYDKGTTADKEKEFSIYRHGFRYILSSYTVVEITYKYVKTAIELKQYETAEKAIDQIEKALGRRYKDNTNLFSLKYILAESKGDKKGAEKWGKKALYSTEYK